jgi:hypothetical protein
LTTQATTFIAGCVRVPWLVALLVVVGSPIVAHSGPPCLPSCDPRAKDNTCCLLDPAFGEACGNYLGLRAAAEAAQQTGEVSDCIARSPRCQPVSPGRCTIVLGCVRRCRNLFGTPIPEKQIQREAFGLLTDCNGEPLNASGRRAAKRTCVRCQAGSVSTTTTTSTTVPTTTVTTTTTTTSTSLANTPTTTNTTTSTRTTTTQPSGQPADEGIQDPCFNACLNRLDSVRRCYKDCDSKCDGDRRARNICRRSCRNGSCLAVKAKCTLNQNNPDQTDLQYKRCCDRSTDGCRDASEAECEPTTTSTSTTSTTNTSTSTSGSSSTTSFTTTTLF